MSAATRAQRHARREAGLTPELEQFWIATYCTHRRITQASPAESEVVAWNATRAEMKVHAAMDEERRQREKLAREEARKFKPPRFQVVPGVSRLFAVADNLRGVAVMETNVLDRAEQRAHKPAPEPAVFALADLNEVEMKLTCRQILRRLKPADADLLTAVFGHDVRQSQMAVELGVSRGRVGQKVWKAMRSARRAALWH